jgi:hypothetical protein
MAVGKYLRANIKYWCNVSFTVQKDMVWGEEGEKLFIFPKNVCPNSSLVQSVARKLSELKFYEKKDVLS